MYPYYTLMDFAGLMVIQNCLVVVILQFIWFNRPSKIHRHVKVFTLSVMCILMNYTYKYVNFEYRLNNLCY